MQKVEVELIDRNGCERSAKQNGGQVGGRWQYLNTKFERECYEQINVLIMNVLMKKKIRRLLFFTVHLRPQIAKANRGGRSCIQSVVKRINVNPKLQQHNNIRLNTKILIQGKKKNKMT